MMGQGLAWILGVADWVADFNDAVRYIKAPAPVVLPLLAVSALFAVLWVGRLRFIGVCGCLLACLDDSAFIQISCPFSSLCHALLARDCAVGLLLSLCR